MGASEAEHLVHGIWFYPVKSMRGHRVDSIFVGEHGIPGDRGLALFDVQADRPASAKQASRWGNLMDVEVHLEQERGGEWPCPVILEFPDGARYSSSDPGIDDLLSRRFGFSTTLGAAAHDQPAFFDLAPLHVIDRGTMAHLEQLHPDSAPAIDRFRPNLLIDFPGSTGGFVENEWIGRRIRIGVDLVIEFTRPCSRCIMTTMAQGDLPGDPAVLKTLADHNALVLGDGGPSPCLGVYARTITTGTIGTGDLVVEESP